MNLYAYVQGDPVNAIDPEGLYIINPYFRDRLERLARSFPKHLAKQTAKYGGRMAECGFEYFVGDIEQKGVYKTAVQLLKTSAKLAVLSKVNNAITYYSVFGLIKCTLSCFSE